jgi:hypothetical protein
MSLAISVDFWDSGPEAIGEDMHMYLKCYFGTAGKVIVKSIYSPASQCNVEGSGDGLTGYASGLKARYVQAKRHLWGTLDFGYMIRRTIEILLTGNVKVNVEEYTKFSDREETKIRIQHIFTMFHRMFEVHILMGHFLTLLIFSNLMIPSPSTSSSYLSSFAQNNWRLFMSDNEIVPESLLLGLKIGYFIRIFMVIPSLMTFYWYEKYHEWVSFGRWELQKLQQEFKKNSNIINIETSIYFPKTIETETDKIQHLGRRPFLISRRTFVNYIDWIITPIVGLLFYVVPMLHAQIFHLWTNKLEYQVASKPCISFEIVPLIPRIENEELVRERTLSVGSFSRCSLLSDEGFFEIGDESVVNILGEGAVVGGGGVGGGVVGGGGVGVVGVVGGGGVGGGVMGSVV